MQRQRIEREMARVWAYGEGDFQAAVEVALAEVRAADRPSPDSPLTWQQLYMDARDQLVATNKDFTRLVEEVRRERERLNDSIYERAGQLDSDSKIHRKNYHQWHLRRFAADEMRCLADKLRHDPRCAPDAAERANRTVHLAGPPEGLVQQCSRCGFVLNDYTGAMSVGAWEPRWWQGAVEVVDGFPRSMHATKDAPNCGADAAAAKEPTARCGTCGCDHTGKECDKPTRLHLSCPDPFHRTEEPTDEQA